MRHARQEFTSRCGVTAQFVGRDFHRWLCLRAQYLSKEALSSLGVLPSLDQDLDPITVSIDRTPEVSALTLDRY